MRVPLLLSILLYSCLAGFGQDNFNVCLINWEKQGHLYQFFTDTKTLERTSAWSPGESEPPLANSAAVKIAREAAKHQFPNAEEIQIDAVELARNSTVHQVGSSMEPLIRWYYIVRYSPKINGEFKYFEPLAQVAILLDGSVITGKMTK